MALSVCCATNGPLDRTATVLAQLRDVADEIVVAVDTSGDELDLTALGSVADRVIEIELGGFVEQALSWLHAQCSAEWILRIDDDEVVGRRLLEELPELIRARDVIQYWVARRWVYPDPGRWLEDWPWFPDFQGRLVRNDARAWFPGLCHTSVAPAMPARYLEGCIYHLTHLVCDRGERETKVGRYRAVDPGLRAPGVDAWLSSYYLPERDHAARLAPVPAGDRLAIDAVLAPAAVPSGGKAGPGARVVSRREIQACWAERTLAADAYRASISPVDVHRHMIAGDHRPFRVRVRNDGTEQWPGSDDRRPLIRAAYRWMTTGGAVVEPEGHRTPFPHPLAPGESCLVAMNVSAPPVPGRYLLEPDLVHEHVRWFDCKAPPVEIEVAAAPVPALR